MNRFRASVFGTLLVVVLAACSSSSGSSPTPSPTPTPAPTPTAAASSAAALPSLNLPNNAKELEALLPDTLGGVKLVKASYKGSDFINSQNSNEEFKTWLTSVGKSLDDVSAAFGFVASGTSGSAIFAFRVQGVDNSRLIDAFKTSAAQGSSTMTWTSANVGGKNVQQAQDPDTKSTVYLYGTADLVFFVSTNDPAVAQEALSHLP
jgi:hypothetical protein